MKTKMKHLVALIIFVGASTLIHAQGYIVPNGVTTNYIPGSGEISVIHDPINSYYTGFFLNPIGKTQPTTYINTFAFGVVVDVGVRVFLVQANDAISLQPILSQNWTELGGSPSYVFANEVPFYVGLYTGNNPFDSHGSYTGIYENPVFGWAELVNNQGIIQLLNYAVEYGGDGIYAGTQNIIQPVPEPNVLGLFALGGLFLAWRRWKAWAI